MATSRVPNRYVRRADLIDLLDRLFVQPYYVSVRASLQCLPYEADIDQEHSDAWVVSGIPRELTEVCQCSLHASQVEIGLKILRQRSSRCPRNLSLKAPVEASDAYSPPANNLPAFG